MNETQNDVFYLVDFIDRNGVLDQLDIDMNAYALRLRENSIYLIILSEAENIRAVLGPYSNDVDLSFIATNFVTLQTSKILQDLYVKIDVEEDIRLMRSRTRVIIDSDNQRYKKTRGLKKAKKPARKNF